MVLELITKMAIQPKVMEEVVPLKDPMLLDHPVILWTDEGLQQGRSQIGVVEGAEKIADIMQKSANHVLLISRIAIGQSGRLETVGQPINRQSSEVPAQQTEMSQNAIGQFSRKGPGVFEDFCPVLGSAVFQIGKLSLSVHRLISCLSCGQPCKPSVIRKKRPTTPA
ncbi:hypothetical protein FQZ97_962910 [compost metagenome]